ILPVLALIVIAVWMLGVGTLKDLSLVLLIGITVGTYSSICTATPFLVSLKQRRKDIKRHDEKVVARRARIAERGRNDDDLSGDDADDDAALDDDAPESGAAGSGGRARGGRATADVAAGSGGGGAVDTPASAPRPGAKPAGTKRRKKS